MICFYCSFQAYAGFFYTARVLLKNGTEDFNHFNLDFDKFNASVKQFCNSHWKVVSSSSCYTATVIRGGEEVEQEGEKKRKRIYKQKSRAKLETKNEACSLKEVVRQTLPLLHTGKPHSTIIVLINDAA